MINNRYIAYENHFYESLSYSKCTQLRVSFYQFFQKRISLNNNIVCANTPESSQTYQKVEAFFTKCPEILRRQLFYSLYAQILRIF